MKKRLVFFSQVNQGSAVARNLAIAKARGDLIVFLDADDFWLLPDKLSQQVKYFEQYDSLGCVHTGWQIVDGDGEKIIDSAILILATMPEIRGNFPE
jgi:glycosyltransferase involved in cell wall biosynthesis